MLESLKNAKTNTDVYNVLTGILEHNVKESKANSRKVNITIAIASVTLAATVTFGVVQVINSRHTANVPASSTTISQVSNEVLPAGGVNPTNRAEQ
jgi:hypothetical protein